MKVTTTMEVPIKKGTKKDEVIISSLPALHMAFGASSVGGNLHIYGITKTKKGYHTSLQVLKERIDLLQQRKLDIEEKLKIMEEIWNQL